MATISTNTYLDDGVTARTAGETWTINTGGNLIIRTDSRWHAQAPAGMVGSLGAITMNGTGGMLIDGTAVRWMAFDTGSGTVPAINTAITQGGVTGTLLGVWTDYVSAPLAPGAAMPASGFIKFREVTGGTFAQGALAGIAANASKPDVVGWIEVVRDQSTSITTTQAGIGFKTRGNWFYLDDLTTGVRGQQIQCPANGGGANTLIYGAQVETAPGSGVFEWWGAVNQTSVWTNTIVASDQRAKAFQSLAGGIIRFGSDGTNNIGWLPPAGCRIRMPNIFLRQCTTAARAAQAVFTTSAIRPGFTTLSSGGIIDMEFAQSDWYTYFQNCSKIRVVNSIIEGSLNVDHCLTPMILTNSCLANTKGASGGLGTFNMINNHAGGTFTDIKTLDAGGNYNVYVSTSDNLIFDNVECLRLTASPSQSVVQFGVSTNISINNVKTIGGGINVSGCKIVNITNHDFIYLSKGATTATGTINCITVGTSSDIVHSGLTFGLNGLLSDTQPYNYLYMASSNNGTIKFRNAGTRANPLNCGTNATLYPAGIFNGNGYSTDCYVQRVFLANTRTGVFTTGSPHSKNYFESCYGTLSGAQTFVNLEDCVFKGLGTTFAVGIQNNYPGVHFYDNFISATAGRFVFLPGSLISATSSAYATLNIDTSNPVAGFTSSTLMLPSVGDSITIETPYFIKGHTALAAANPTISGASVGNMVMEYDVNTGSGYSGTWKVMNSTNFAAETINPAGTKMKVRVRTITANNANSITSIYCSTVTSVTDQANNLYDLDVVNLSFTGLIPGSEVRCYTGTDPATATEIAGVENTAGTSFSFTHSNGGQVGSIVILAMGYQPIYIPYTYKSTNDSILIQPVIDRNYNNPA